MQPRALDLFCGAGGATRGLQLAGFEVTGVDLVRSPRYVGDAFIQGDALTVPLDGYDFIWASPPCQAYSGATNRNRRAFYRAHADLIAPIRARLVAARTRYTIENVPGAPLRGVVMLCGSSFGLDVRRHRWFETSFLTLAPACDHHRQTPRFRSLDSRRVDKLAAVISVHGHLNYPGEFALRCEAMGIDWMTNAELS